MNAGEVLSKAARGQNGQSDVARWAAGSLARCAGARIVHADGRQLLDRYQHEPEGVRYQHGKRVLESCGGGGWEAYGSCAGQQDKAFSAWRGNQPT